jgi:hypothetical protein
VLLAIVAALGFVIYRSRNRRKTGAIVAISVVWVLGVGGALSQLVPGITQRLPMPLSLEGQRDVREVTLAQAKDIAAFPIYTPTYLPGKLSSESVHVQRAGRSSGVVVILLYYDPRSSSQVEIRQSQAGSEAVSPGQSNLSIMGQNARVTSSAAGSTVEWSIGPTFVEIAGEYPREQMIQLARSMR